MSTQTSPDRSTRDDAPGRRRLLTALRMRPTRGAVVAAVLLALLGFALAVQLRSNRESNLATLRQQDLVRILDDVSERGQRLQQEVNDLERTRQELANGSGGSLTALQEARDRAQTLAILAGTAPAVGPGIVMTIHDPKGQVRATRLLDAVEELRDADAEAIQIGSVRVVASTWFLDAQGGINVDGTVLTPPYTVKVIGDPRGLESSLDIPGGVLELLRQQGADPVVTRPDTVEIPALHPLTTPQYARPAPEATGGSGG